VNGLYANPVSERLSFVGKTKEEVLENLDNFLLEYAEQAIVKAEQAYAQATVPAYAEQVLYIMMQRLKRVHTPYPLTRVGIGAHKIANMVMPRVWQMVEGDREKYLKFYEKQIVPLGVKAEDLVSFDLSEQDMLEYSKLKRAEEGRLC
jgi:hypothetical protein